MGKREQRLRYVKRLAVAVVSVMVVYVLCWIAAARQFEAASQRYEHNQIALRYSQNVLVGVNLQLERLPQAVRDQVDPGEPYSTIDPKTGKSIWHKPPADVSWAVWTLYIDAYRANRDAQEDEAARCNTERTLSVMDEMDRVQTIVEERAHEAQD